MPTTTTTLPIFYVYVLYHDVEFTLPFYVGKGKGRRVRDHTLPGNLRPGDAKALIVRGLLDTIGFVPHQIVERDLGEKAALSLEQALVKAFARAPDGPLVNQTDGGDAPTRGHTGHRHSLKTRAKISQILTGKKQSEITKAKRNGTLSKMFKGKQRGRITDRTREKHTAAMVALWASEEGRALMSAAGMRGKHHTPETIEKIRKSNTGQIRSAKTRLKMSISAKKRDEEWLMRSRSKVF